MRSAIVCGERSRRLASNRVDTFDLAVIGAGSGGLVAAIVAHKLGLKTALIEARLFGGD